MTTQTKEVAVNPSGSSGQPSPDEPEGSGKPTIEGENPPQDPPSDGTPSPASNDESSQSPFTLAQLKGRTPEQIESLFKTMGATINEQKRALDEGFSRSQPPKPQGEAPSAPKKELEARDFWNDPIGVMKSVIRDDLEEVIAPFRENLAHTRATAAEQQVKAQFPDYDDYAPLIDQIRKNHGIDSPTAEQLQSMYYLAVGIASRQSAETMPTNNEPAPPAAPRNPSPPPQHRASSQPLPDGSSKPKARPLTESERLLAREFNMTEEEFRANELSTSDPLEL